MKSSAPSAAAIAANSASAAAGGDESDDEGEGGEEGEGRSGGADPLPCYPSTVVYGHAASRDLDVRRWSVGLDSGCLYGRRLTALVLTRAGHGKYALAPSRTVVHSDDGEEEEDEDEEDEMESCGRWPRAEGTSEGTSRLPVCIEVRYGDGYALLGALEMEGELLSTLSHSSEQ